MAEYFQELLSDRFVDLGASSLMRAVAKLVPVKGLTLADVGCGGGVLAGELAARGATVTGVEPDPIQAEKNRQAEPVPGLTFIEARAEQLPFADASLDGVFFRYSLHHVPGEQMAAALQQAARVLKPRTGYLYVVEPLLAGSMQAVYKPFHDETKVRTSAYKALKAAASLFAEMREYRYGEEVRYDSFEAFRDRTLAQTYNQIDRERLESPKVRALFERGRVRDGYLFDRFNRVNLFTGPLAA